MIGKQVCIAVGLMLLAGSQGLAQEPEDVLKTNGLVKSGKFFVLPEEEKVGQGLFNLRPVMGRVDTTYNAWAAIIQNESELQQLTDYRIQVQGQLNDFRVAFNNMPARNPLERLQKQEASQQFAEFDNVLRWTNSEVELRRKRVVGPVGKQKAEDDFKSAREKFVQAKGQLWPDVDSMQKKYDELKSNDSVLNALRAYNTQAQARIKIGPSDDLSKKAKLVINYERNYSPETAPQPTKLSRPKRVDRNKRRGSQVSSMTRNEAPGRFELRLMSSESNVGDIPKTGKNLVIVANVGGVLYFRVFDPAGNCVVDTDESRLTTQAGPIAALKRQLEDLRPPHKLVKSEEDRVIAAVTSIVGHIAPGQ